MVSSTVWGANYFLTLVAVGSFLLLINGLCFFLAACRTTPGSLAGGTPHWAALHTAACALLTGKFLLVRENIFKQPGISCITSGISSTPLVRMWGYGTKDDDVTHKNGDDKPGCKLCWESLWIWTTAEITKISKCILRRWSLWERKEKKKPWDFQNYEWERKQSCFLR